MPSRTINELLNRTLVVVAHPDDECVGAGVLLQRMEHAFIAFCTDGGPRDKYFWEKYGSREEYARIRKREAECVAQSAAVEETEFLSITDQELYLNLQPALEQLKQIVNEFQPAALLTIAYEGGHPDHDCCAFLGYRLGRKHNLPVWEMPLYHRTKEGPRQQEFLASAQGNVEISISESELERKRRMVACYVSQAGVLNGFDLSIERFRPQAEYDFSQPPQAEIINYEVWEWPMRASDMCSAFRAIEQSGA